MRENRTYGSEGGEAKAFPTPISVRCGCLRKNLHFLSGQCSTTLGARFREGDKEPPIARTPKFRL